MKFICFPLLQHPLDGLLSGNCGISGRNQFLFGPLSSLSKKLQAQIVRFFLLLFSLGSCIQSAYLLIKLFISDQETGGDCRSLSLSFTLSTPKRWECGTLSSSIQRCRLSFIISMRETLGEMRNEREKVKRAKPSSERFFASEREEIFWQFVTSGERKVGTLVSFAKNKTFCLKIEWYNAVRYTRMWSEHHFLREKEKTIVRWKESQDRKFSLSPHFSLSP